MKAAKNTPVDVKTVGLVTAGGAVVMFMAAQLLAKPSLPPTAKVAARPAAPLAAGAGHGSLRAAAPSATSAGLEPVKSASGRLPLAGDAPVRELFRPLVAKPDTNANPATAAPAPKLPSVDKKGADSLKETKPQTVAASQPAGPRAGDIQMLGVTELGGEVKTLLKNSVTGERRYFARGEDAFGFKVGEIKADEVALLRGGQTERVAMSSAIVIEGPGGASSSGSSGFKGGDRRGGGGGDAQGFSTAQIFSLPTWSERLKKLDEVKAQIEPERYQRLRKFMADKAAEEATQGKK